VQFPQAHLSRYSAFIHEERDAVNEDIDLDKK
jgi:hypothetical protein